MPKNFSLNRIKMVAKRVTWYINKKSNVKNVWRYILEFYTGQKALLLMYMGILIRNSHVINSPKSDAKAEMNFDTSNHIKNFEV